ncbi:MAG TPA: ScyD/ScyE family protein [Gemmataceae bacterium]|nr:ScyD/ScyE family protein [Gemmataceae bacterium]
MTWLFSARTGLAVAVAAVLGFAARADGVELERPSKLLLTPAGNLLVAEVRTATSPANSGRVSIVDPAGNRRTLIDGLPSAPTNAANTPSGPSGLFLRGRTLFVAIGEGNPTLAGPVPRTEIPNPAVASPIFSSVLAVHFSVAVERKTTGIELTLADHVALKAGDRLVRTDAGRRKITIELVVDFPDYVPEPVPALAANVRHSHPYGVVADDEYLYVPDGGYNLVHKVDIESGQFATLVSFPPSPNPTPVGPRTVENVPTSIRWDGSRLLVTLLSGFPFVAGLSEVRTVDPDTGATATLIAGLSSAIDVIPVTVDRDTVGYLTLEYSLAHLAGGPGRLMLFNASGTPIAVLADTLITPSSLALDARSRPPTIVVSQIGPGNLVTVPLQ